MPSIKANSELGPVKKALNFLGKTFVPDETTRAYAGMVRSGMSSKTPAKAMAQMANEGHAAFGETAEMITKTNGVKATGKQLSKDYSYMAKQMVDGTDAAEAQRVFQDKYKMTNEQFDTMQERLQDLNANEDAFAKAFGNGTAGDTALNALKTAGNYLGQGGVGGIATKVGAYAVGAYGIRLASGSANPLRNSKGERDIAGIPFV